MKISCEVHIVKPLYTCINIQLKSAYAYHELYNIYMFPKKYLGGGVELACMLSKCAHKQLNSA